MCNVCKEKFPFDKIKYSKDGISVVCGSCYDKIIKKEAESAKRKPAAAMAQDEIKMICTNCSYRFSLKNKTRFSLRCPYCGSKTSLIKDNITADRLIEEVSGGKRVFA